MADKWTMPEIKSDFLWSIYVMPHLICHAFRRWRKNNYPLSYFADVFIFFRFRKGRCNMCGTCCKGCNQLGADNKCKIYKRRWWCEINFPINRQQLKTQPDCGFYWGHK